MSPFVVSNWVSLLPLLISVLAVTIGPLVALRISKKQIVSPIRQKWIDDLRELISEYLSVCEGLIVLGKDDMLNQEVMDENLYKRLLLLEQKLKLKLNPNEEMHQELLEIIHLLTDGVHQGVTNILQFGGWLKGATEITRKILKEEWQKIST